MSDNLPPDLERLIEEGVADQSIFTPANRDAPEGATEAQEREQRYAEAIHGNRTGLPAMCEVASDEDDEVSCWVLADAAIRVADAEQAELRTDVEALTGLLAAQMERTKAAEAALAEERAKVAAVYDVWNGKQNVNWLRVRIRERWPELGRVLDDLRSLTGPTETGD